MTKKETEKYIRLLTRKEQRELLALCLEIMDQTDVIEVITSQQPVSDKTKEKETANEKQK
jgi:hypothetical protein